MSAERIRTTFEHIKEYWPEKGYKQCKREWDNIQPLISKEATPYQCKNCSTYWKIEAMLNIIDNICPRCDTWCQPFLCNPINHESVLKYICPSYHKYLIPIDFSTDTNSYIVCRHSVSNISDLNILSFRTIQKVYKYVTKKMRFIAPTEFMKCYRDYLEGTHVKNGHNVLFSPDFVAEFQHKGSQYEIYRIDKDSKCAVAIFIHELSIIGSVRGHKKRDDSIAYMKDEYNKIYNEGDVPDDDFMFGMIFYCNY
jgi:hypothetical protein